jgi:hypothetical protein
MKTDSNPIARGELRLLLAVTAAAVLGAFLLPPIPQDPGYHGFADQRSWLGLPNAANVLSNLPFLVVGLLGLREFAGGSPPGTIPGFRIGYVVFFAGIAAIGVGSAYYHLNPDNGSLVWDRLPMTVAFMALTAVVLAEHVSLSLARRLLWPLEVAGILSVWYWHATELAGRGDLRPYGLVQFLPMVLIPFVLWRIPSKLSGTGFLWLLLAGYALAKVAEMADEAIFRTLGILSGHALKHLLAAGAAWCMVLAVRNRRLKAAPVDTRQRPVINPALE